MNDTDSAMKTIMIANFLMNTDVSYLEFGGKDDAMKLILHETEIKKELKSLYAIYPVLSKAVVLNSIQNAFEHEFRMQKSYQLLLCQDFNRIGSVQTTDSLYVINKSGKRRDNMVNSLYARR